MFWVEKAFADVGVIARKRQMHQVPLELVLQVVVILKVLAREPSPQYRQYMLWTTEPSLYPPRHSILNKEIAFQIKSREFMLYFTSVQLTCMFLKLS